MKMINYFELRNYVRMFLLPFQFMYGITVGLATALVAIFQTDGFYLRQNLGAFAAILFLYG